MKNNSELICEAEKVYSFCWNILSRVKKRLPQENRTDLGMFQIRLARILFQLEKRHIQISQEINKDKKNKKSSLLLEKKRLTQCINIGKAIGDAFAWIFYVHSQDLLEKHQSQPSNGPSPATKGIYAEILFLEKYQLDNGYFYIYHGITTSYRLGDFSIYDISKGKIIGIIELKTKFTEPRRISQEINVIFSSDLSTEYIKALNIENKLVKHTHNTNPEAEIRKNRQLLRIENACKDIYLQKSISVTTQSNKSHINELVSILNKSKYGFTFTQLTPYLGVVSFKSRKRRLSSILTEFCNTHEKLDELNLSKKAEIITNKNWDNKILVSRYLYGESEIIGYLGEQPVFWQINNLNIAKDIYFLRISIANLFNPGFFHYQMSEKGWIYRETEDCYYKKTDNKSIEIHSIKSYIQLMCCFYVTEEYIFESIKASIDIGLEKESSNTNVAGDIHINIQ